MTADTEGSSNNATDAQLLHKLPMFAGALALILIVSYAVVFRALPFDQNPGAWGSFGDFIGGLLNPLISLFTLIVAVSVWKLQKTELEETRKAVKEQGTIAEQQRREQRFFDLLNLYQETLKTFIFENSIGKAALSNWSKMFTPHTQDCLIFLSHGWADFEYHYEEKDQYSGYSVHKTATRSISNQQVAISWASFSPALDHYFRTVFAILGELEKLLGSDHWHYAKLFRAQFSRDELTLLAFNLLFDDEGKKMRSIVYKYGLLKHLANTKLRDYAIEELNPEAFGRAWIEAQKTDLPSEERQLE